MMNEMSELWELSLCDDLTLGEVVIIIIDIYTPCISILPNAKEVH